MIFKWRILHKQKSVIWFPSDENYKLQDLLRKFPALWFSNEGNSINNSLSYDIQVRRITCSQIYSKNSQSYDFQIKKLLKQQPVIWFPTEENYIFQDLLRKLPALWFSNEESSINNSLSYDFQVRRIICSKICSESSQPYDFQKMPKGT